MPESVRDRPTKAHEQVFLLSKQARYFYDAEAIAEQAESRPQQRLTSTAKQPMGASRAAAGVQNPTCQGGTSSERNKRSVWTVATQPLPKPTSPRSRRSLPKPASRQAPARKAVARIVVHSGRGR